MFSWIIGITKIGLGFMSGKNIKYIGYALAIFGFLFAIWYMFIKPISSVTSDLNTCISSQAIMNETILKNKIKSTHIEDSLKAEIKKLKDDMAVSYSDGRKQGEADAKIHKCIKFDLWTS